MDALTTISKLGSGHFIEDVNAELARVAAEVIATGKPGKVTVTLTVSKPQGMDPVVTVLESIGSTLPKQAAQGAFLFFLDGVFHQRDPRQAELDLREVKPATQLRDGSKAEPTLREERAT